MRGSEEQNGFFGSLSFSRLFKVFPKPPKVTVVPSVRPPVVEEMAVETPTASSATLITRVCRGGKDFSSVAIAAVVDMGCNWTTYFASSRIAAGVPPFPRLPPFILGYQGAVPTINRDYHPRSTRFPRQALVETISEVYQSGRQFYKQAYFGAISCEFTAYKVFKNNALAAVTTAAFSGAVFYKVGLEIILGSDGIARLQKFLKEGQYRQAYAELARAIPMMTVREMSCVIPFFLMNDKRQKWGHWLADNYESLRRDTGEPNSLAYSITYLPNLPCIAVNLMANKVASVQLKEQWLIMQVLRHIAQQPFPVKTLFEGGWLRAFSLFGSMYIFGHGERFGHVLMGPVFNFIERSLLYTLTVAQQPASLCHSQFMRQGDGHVTVSESTSEYNPKVPKHFSLATSRYMRYGFVYDIPGNVSPQIETKQGLQK